MPSCRCDDRLRAEADELLTKAEQSEGRLASGYRQMAARVTASTLGEPFTKGDLLAKAFESEGAIRAGYLERAARCP